MAMKSGDGPVGVNVLHEVGGREAGDGDVFFFVFFGAARVADAHSAHEAAGATTADVVAVVVGVDGNDSRGAPPP